MDEYIEFTRNHPLLVFGFLGVLGLIVWTEFNRVTRKYKQLDINSSVRLLNNDETVCVDVREDKELGAGMLADARHIPLSQFANRMGELANYKNKPVLVYCRSGSRSGHACNMLTKNGFEDVSNMAGGIIAWESAKLPVTSR